MITKNNTTSLWTNCWGVLVYTRFTGDPNRDVKKEAAVKQ